MQVAECPKCSQKMEEGFILDHNHSNTLAAEWVEGPPQYSFWTGLKLRGKERHLVATYCCPKCGFLESYARFEKE